MTPAIVVLAACSGNMASTTPNAGYQLPSHGSPVVQTVRPAEIYNYFQTTVSLPPSYPQPNDFEVNFSGDDISEICETGNPPCKQQALYGPFDPFCGPSHGPSNPCYPTVTFSPTANVTTVTYAGPTLFQNIPSQPGKYHFGLLAGFGDSQQLDRLYGCSYWTFANAPAVPQPFVNVNWSPTKLMSTNWAYAEVYVSVALNPHGPTLAGFWTEIAYVPRGTAQPTLTFTNNGTQPLYVTSSGIVPNQPVPTNPACRTNASCPQDMAILATLSFSGSPPPGYTGSPFVPLTHPPKSVLQPQKNSSCNSV
ncbi:MAG: hypothetical protein JO104_06705 [Candidatus Eremiobacteraeota bacterium]|nr:hypothetical protein [Candidatus Eremiobacteraeota bacterium]